MPHEAANGNGGTLGKPCPSNTEARRDTEALLHEAEYLTTSVPKRSACDFALTSAAGSYMMTPYASLSALPGRPEFPILCMGLYWRDVPTRPSPGWKSQTTRFQTRLGRRPERPAHNGPKALVFYGRENKCV